MPLAQPASPSALEAEYSDGGLFAVGPEHGFLPRCCPLRELPERYAALDALLQRLPVWTDFAKGEQGVLASKGAIVQHVHDLPDYTEEVSKETDVALIAALFRSYAFLCSAYLLEKTYYSQMEEKTYGPARRSLPAMVASPFCIVAERLGVQPWLDYHYAYSLNNYVLKDDSDSAEEDGRSLLSWENLNMAVKFSGTPDEIGFIMLHVDINQHSPELLRAVYTAVASSSAAAAAAGDSAAEAAWRGGMRTAWLTLRKMNARRREMWRASNWRNYNDFRCFIMGIEGNEAIFGDGVVYQGTDDLKPRKYRGQSGSQDDIIPTADIFTGLIDYYPDNILTRYLMDMRTYRPPCVRAFFTDLEKTMKQAKGDESHLWRMFASHKWWVPLVYLLGALDEIYQFRNGHWQFVQKYIMSTTKYPVATGGTPITTWLPNQIEACLKAMDDILQALSDNAAVEAALGGQEEVADAKELLDTVRSGHSKRVALLRRQMNELSKAAFDVELVYNWNDTFNQKDCRE